MHKLQGCFILEDCLSIYQEIHIFNNLIALLQNNNLSGYIPPAYNKLKTTLLQQEMTHIEILVEHTRNTWPEKGVTICSYGWSDARGDLSLTFSLLLRVHQCSCELSM